MSGSNFFGGQFFGGGFFGALVTKVGGDDVPYRRSPHKGWSREEWEERVRKPDQEIEKTLRAAYAEMTTESVPAVILAQVDAIVRPVSKETEERLSIDWQRMAQDFERSNAMMKLWQEEERLRLEIEEDDLDVLMLLVAMEEG